MNCIFCHDIKEDQPLTETENFKVIFDIDPIQSGHLLILSKHHYLDIRELSNPLILEFFQLQKRIIDLLEKNFAVDGVSIIQNNGKIMDEGTHLHVHIIPRYTKDAFWDNQEVVEHTLSIEKLKIQLKNMPI